MTTLQDLRVAADKAERDFDDACRPHYCDARWGYYRAVECGQSVPAAVEAACNEYHRAAHAYYAARDGERGFLGSRGC